MQSKYTLVKLPHLLWIGHVIRMPDEQLPKKVFYGELQVGKRSQGGRKKRHKEEPSSGNRLHKIVQSDIAVSEKEQRTMKPRVCKAEQRHNARAKG